MLCGVEFIYGIIDHELMAALSPAMKFIWKTLKRIGYFMSLIFIGLFIYIHTLLGLNFEWMWRGKFSDEVRPTAFTLDLGHRQLFGVDSMDETKIPLLMVHGSPGSWTGWEDYFKDLKLRQQYRLIAVDRPGYGWSGFRQVERSLKQQSDDIAAVFERLPKDQKVVLMGHSYGGPVVARMAMDYPDKISAVLILAGSVDPALEETKWIQHVAKWPIIRWLVPPFAYSSNEEIIGLKQGLEDALPLWKNIAVPVIIIHGEADTLVPVANVDFMETKLTNAASVEVIRISNGSHFVPWSYYWEVTDALDRLASGLSDSRK